MGKAEEIYQALIAPIEQRMMRTVARIVRDPDETADVFQTVLMRVWKSLRKIHTASNPQGYIMRVCVNASCDALRRRARRRLHEAPMEAADGAAAPNSTPGADESSEAIQRAVARLPRKQAQAFLLRALEEEPFEAIARALGCREATARSHYCKGRARLRQILAKSEVRPGEGE